VELCRTGNKIVTKYLAAEEMRIMDSNQNEHDGQSQEQNVQDKQKKETASGLTIGLCIGTGLGVVFGLTVFDNIGVGLSIGIGCGLAIGTALDRRKS